VYLCAWLRFKFNSVGEAHPGDYASIFYICWQNYDISLHLCEKCLTMLALIWRC
jgi:hypothetical protein